MAKPSSNAECVFCRIVKGEVAAHEVMREDGVVAFLDRSPLFKGHVLVVPTEHHVVLGDLPDSELSRYFTVVRAMSAAMVDALGAQGSFVAMNNVVSQSVPHLHTHVVPRTKGDGLRGFFWPRTKYSGEDEASAYAARISSALAI
jgi:histidine triad (HIT) family protein